MQAIDKELSEMKITLNARARTVAEEFMKNVSCVSQMYVQTQLTADYSIFSSTD